MAAAVFFIAVNHYKMGVGFRLFYGAVVVGNYTLLTARCLKELYNALEIVLSSDRIVTFDIFSNLYVIHFKQLYTIFYQLNLYY